MSACPCKQASAAWHLVSRRCSAVAGAQPAAPHMPLAGQQVQCAHTCNEHAAQAGADPASGLLASPLLQE